VGPTPLSFWSGPRKYRWEVSYKGSPMPRSEECCSQRCIRLRRLAHLGIPELCTQRLQRGNTANDRYWGRSINKITEPRHQRPLLRFFPVNGPVLCPKTQGFQPEGWAKLPHSIAHTRFAERSLGRQIPKAWESESASRGTVLGKRRHRQPNHGQQQPKLHFEPNHIRDNLI
jgi:hypothetical protein